MYLSFNSCVSQVKAQELTCQVTKLDAEVQEAKAAERRGQVEKLQMQLVNDNLANNNKWLEENLSHLSDSLKSERQKTALEVQILSESSAQIISCH